LNLIQNKNIDLKQLENKVLQIHQNQSLNLHANGGFTTDPKKEEITGLIGISLE